MRIRSWVLAACFAVTGCGGDSGDPVDDAVRWRVVYEKLPGALIGITGTADDDVWTSGGDPGDGSGPMVLHFDGKRWKRMLTGESGDLWWIHAFAGGPVFLGGSQGTILRYEAGSFTKMPTPGTNTVFGIWGASADDLWAVGGDPQKPGTAFVWRSDGQTWTAASGAPSVPITSYFKVWGRSASDVRIVGNDGVILHYDGTTLSEETSPTNRKLLTVHVDQTGPWVAVGGLSQAVIVEDDGGWKDVSPPSPSHALFGVRMAGDEGYAVGTAATVMHRSAGTWSDEPLGFDLYSDLHSAWIAPSGRVWVVGGDLLAFPLVNGVLLQKGRPVAAGSYE